jgi:lipopolysaccharide transport system permease protein
MISPLTLRSLWAYRGFVLGSVKREFQSKYSQAMLGALWSLLSPLAMILVYTVIFSEVMHNRLPGAASNANARFAYSIYLCAGVLTWGLFAEIVARAQTMFLDQANMLKKLNFPRITVPVIVVLNALANFGIIFGLFTVFLLVSNSFPGPVFLALLPVLAVLLLLAIGLGLVAGVLGVFFRDVGPFLTIAMQFWFWLTPVVYPATILPPEVRALLGWNPMARLVGACQDILVAGKAPDWGALLPVLVLALLLCAAGLRLFRRHAGDMVDEL